jgi:hypothetical protein
MDDGYTPTEERCMEAIERELMDSPDLDGICRLMGMEMCTHLAGLLWDGKPDEARDMLYKYGRMWAQREAERELNGY